MNNLKRLTLALCATMTLAAGAAQAAGDIQVVNGTDNLIHPYFKSNCWNPGQPGVWLYFGGIGAHDTFTWPDFSTMLRPNCKHPVVKFTFTLDGEPDPTEKDQDRTVVMQYDATENHRAVLGYIPVVLDDLAY